MFRSFVLLALVASASLCSVQAEPLPAPLATQVPLDVSSLSTLSSLVSAEGPVSSCFTLKDAASCSSSTETKTGLACTWCHSMAVGSVCVNTQQATHLPPAVFSCGNSEVHTQVAEAEETGPGAACRPVKDQATCDSTSDSGIPCVWCKCSAVPSSCVRSDMAKHLPPSVFQCDKPTPKQMFTARL